MNNLSWHTQSVLWWGISRTNPLVLCSYVQIPGTECHGLGILDLCFFGKQEFRGSEWVTGQQTPSGTFPIAFLQNWVMLDSSAWPWLLGKLQESLLPEMPSQASRLPEWKEWAKVEGFCEGWEGHQGLEHTSTSSVRIPTLAVWAPGPHTNL